MTPFFAFLDVGTPELLLIMLAILLLFGGERLPSVAKGLGKSIRDFRKASAGVEEEIRKAIESEPEPAHKPRIEPPKSEEPKTEAPPFVTPPPSEPKA